MISIIQIAAGILLMALAIVLLCGAGIVAVATYYGIKSSIDKRDSGRKKTRRSKKA